MKVNSIKITNILGIENLEINPGRITVVSGANGAGKTSVLEAVRATMSGGHEPDLIRQGAREGAVLITLDNGVTISKVIRPDKSTLTVRHPDFGKVSKSQAFIDQVVDSLSLDPIAFLRATDKDRSRMLLEALPMRVTREQLSFIPGELLADVDLDRHAMVVLRELHKLIYDERTGINRVAQEKRTTANQIGLSLPPAPPEGGSWREAYDARAEEYRRLQKETNARVNGIRKDAETAKQAAKDIFVERNARLTEDMQTEIDQIRLRYGTLREREEKIRDEHLAKIEAAQNTQLRTVQSEYGPRNTELSQACADAKAQAEAATRAQQAAELAQEMNAKAAELEVLSNKMTAHLGELEGLKSALLQSLPIAGLEVVDGQVLVNGIPFDRVNTAQQFRIAIAIAQARAGDLGVILVDRAEIFDSANWEDFQRAVAESGAQVLAARVGEGPLSVESAL